MIRGGHGPQELFPRRPAEGTNPAGDRIPGHVTRIDSCTVSPSPQAQGRHPTHRHPHRLGTGPPGSRPIMIHPQSRARTAQGHIMMGLEGQASTQHPSGPRFLGHPTHYSGYDGSTRHQKRELSWNTPRDGFQGPRSGINPLIDERERASPHHLWGATQNPKRHHYNTIQGARHPPPQTPAAEPSSQAGSRQAGREQAAGRETNKKNPRANQSQPTHREQAAAVAAARRGPLCAPTAPSNRGRRGWRPLSRVGFPSYTWGTGGGEPPPIPRIIPSHSDLNVTPRPAPRPRRASSRRHASGHGGADPAELGARGEHFSPPRSPRRKLGGRLDNAAAVASRTQTQYM